MPDTRPRVSLTKPVDLEQLAAEVGAALCASDSEVVVADPDSPVTAAQLQAAVDAHIPPAPAADPDDDLAARIQTVHDDPQVSASVKKLTAALLGLNGEAAVAGRPTGA